MKRPFRHRLTKSRRFLSSSKKSSRRSIKTAYADSQDAFSGASIFGMNPSVAMMVDSMFRRAGLETYLATAHVDGDESLIILSVKYLLRPLNNEELASVCDNIIKRIEAIGFRNVKIVAHHDEGLGAARFHIRQKNVTF